MQRLKLLLVLIFVFIFPMEYLLAIGTSSKTMIFAGAGSNLAITRILAEAFTKTHPGVTINVPESIGSTGGIRAVSDGAVTIGLSARPFREQEKKLGLEEVPYARTLIVIGVHPGVADDNITFEEIVQIYRGKKTKWKNGQNIIVLTRDKGESTIEIMEQIIPGFREANDEGLQARRWIVAFTDQDMNRLLTTTPNALGMSDLGTILSEHLNIKMLKINGTSPTPENVIKGRYVLVKGLNFVFKKDKLPPEAKAFMDFVRSKQGQKILKENGYLGGA